MAKKEMSRNEKACMYGLVGGLLMLIAGVTGAATWEALGDAIVQWTGQESLRIAFQVLVLVSSLGGLLVILGALMIGGRRYKVFKTRKVGGGKLLITIGAGFGIIGLLIFLAVTVMGDDALMNILGAIGIGFVGLILSIVARMMAKK